MAVVIITIMAVVIIITMVIMEEAITTIIKILIKIKKITKKKKEGKRNKLSANYRKIDVPNIWNTEYITLKGRACVTSFIFPFLMASTTAEDVFPASTIVYV